VSGALEFEKPLVQMEGRLEELLRARERRELVAADEVATACARRIRRLRHDIFSRLKPVASARADRPPPQRAPTSSTWRGLMFE